MIAYVDASVLLRVALGQPNALPEWRHIDRGVSSAFVTTESLRTLDRLRLRAALSDIEMARRRSTILALIDSLELIENRQSRPRSRRATHADRARHARRHTPRVLVALARRDRE
jgi:hypothetical protein